MTNNINNNIYNNISNDTELEKSSYSEVSAGSESGVLTLQQQFNQTSVANAQTIRDCVAIAMENYFSHLDGQEVFDVYDMVMNEVEAPLFEAVMKYTHDNQTKASSVLGLNRGTLRKKLKQYGML